MWVIRDTTLILLQGYIIQMLVLRDITLILLQGYDTNVGAKGHDSYIITGL